MAFSPAKSIDEISVHSKVTENMIIWAPGNPGDTYTKGDVVVHGAGSGNYGCVITSSDSSAVALGIVHRTTVCPSASTAFPVPGKPPLNLDGDVAKTLIPIEVLLPVGTRLLKGPWYANAGDETVTAYSAASRYVGLTTGLGTDNYGAGSLVYVYEGPGKGEVNVIESYDHTGGTVEKMAVFHRPFNATLTTSSKLLIFGKNAAAAGDGISPVGSFMDLDDPDQFDVADGYDDGNYMTFMDWWLLGGLLADGCCLAVQYSASP